MRHWAAVFILLAGFALSFAAPSRAYTEEMFSPDPDVLALSRALLIPESMEILREEGLANGADLGREMPRGGQGSLWQHALRSAYDPSRMLVLFDRAFATALDGDPQTVRAATAFFTAEPARRALMLELSARRALLDDDVEAAAAQAYGQVARENPDRQALIDRFVAANDLIELNVAGALNANLAFLRGVAEVSGDALGMTEADMLAQVGEAEAATRAEMIGWLLPFLVLAYQPMTDADLASYIAFSETREGRRLNAAMFAAFDAMFADISRDLGRAYGRSMQGDDI